MLAEKLDRTSKEAGAGVRGAVQELSKRLSDLRDTAPGVNALRSRTVAGSPGGAAEPAAAGANASSADLALVKTAIEAERQRGLQLREEIDELMAKLSLLEDENRRVGQLRAERDEWSGRARMFAASLLAL